MGIDFVVGRLSVIRYTAIKGIYATDLGTLGFCRLVISYLGLLNVSPRPKNMIGLEERRKHIR